MQIVHDCLAIARESSDDTADRTVAAEAEQRGPRGVRGRAAG